MALADLLVGLALCFGTLAAFGVYVLISVVCAKSRTQRQRSRDDGNCQQFHFHASNLRTVRATIEIRFFPVGPRANRIRKRQRRLPNAIPCCRQRASCSATVPKQSTTR